MKKLLALTMAVVMLLGMLTFNVSAEENVQDQITWYVDNNVLTLNGQGEMDDYYCVTTTAPWYKYRNSIEKIIVNSGITSISEYAFYGFNKAYEIFIPESVAKIDYTSLIDCDSLVKIHVAENNRNYISMDGVLLSKDKKALVKYPKSKKEGKYIIPTGVEVIEPYAFDKCVELQNIVIPNSVLSIGMYAFHRCENLEEIIIPDNVNYIGASAFKSCSNVKNIKISNSISKINYCTFAFCENLEEIIIPDNVKSIESTAFGYCKNLTSVILPTNTTYANDAFVDCDKLDKNSLKRESVHSVTNNQSVKDTNTSLNNDVSVILNGTKIDFDVQPQIINGRTLVPMRKIFEELGAVVDWEDSTQTAIGTKGDITIKISINDYTLYKNGVPNVLDVPAQLIDSRTLVPIRAISESFGCSVEWEPISQSVLISTYTTTQIPTYAKYPSVPDWGAITKDILLQEQTIEGAYLYIYQTIDKYKSYESYIEKLEQSEYSLMGNPIITDEYTWYTFEHSDNSLPYIGLYFENNENSNVIGVAIPDYRGMGSTNGTITTSDIEEYLENNYDTVNINGKEYKVSFTVLANPFEIEVFDYDFEIRPSIKGFSVEENLVSEKYSELSVSEKNKAVKAIKNFIQGYAEDIINKFPEYLIQGKMGYVVYKYPNLKLEPTSISYFNWCNFDTKNLKSLEPSNFRWKPSMDTYTFDFNEYFVDLETNIPVTVEKYGDEIMIYEISDISYDSTKSDEDDEDIFVEFMLYAGGSGYVYFNMYDEDDNFLDSRIESIDPGKNYYKQQWNKKTKKIIISEDEDIDGLKNNKLDFEADVPVTLVGEYAFEGELTIEECTLVDCPEFMFGRRHDFLISASGKPAYIYLNFFDEKGRYLDYRYEYIYAKKDVRYSFDNLPENTHSVKFSREKIYR